MGVKVEVGVNYFTMGYLHKFKDTKASGLEKLQAILKEPKSVTKYAHPIPLSVNCYELLKNPKEPTKNKTEIRRLKLQQITERKGPWQGERREREGKKGVIIIGDSHARWCVAELTLNLEEN